jgi:hypothetical protein
MLAPAVLAEPPPGWVEAAEIPRPPLGDAADATFLSFRAHRSPDGREARVLACVAAPIPGWVEDMRPSLEGRGVALAGAAAQRAAGRPIDARPEGDHLVLRIAGGGPEPIGAARTFLGFSDDRRVVTCLAVCARTDDALGDCVARVEEVRFTPGAPPPAPGAALSAVTWAVHHPGRTATTAGVLATAAAVLALVTRRRPRTRI